MSLLPTSWEAGPPDCEKCLVRDQTPLLYFKLLISSPSEARLAPARVSHARAKMHVAWVSQKIRGKWLLVSPWSLGEGSYRGTPAGPPPCVWIRTGITARGVRVTDHWIRSRVGCFGSVWVGGGTLCGVATMVSPRLPQDGPGATGVWCAYVLMVWSIVCVQMEGDA